MGRRAPKWPWACIALGSSLWLAVSPVEQRAHRATAVRAGWTESGEVAPAFEAEDRAAPFSGTAPQQPPRRLHTTRPPAAQRADEATSSEAKPEAESESPPWPDELRHPPASPWLPIWAYPGVIPDSAGAPTHVTRVFDATAPRRAVERELRRRDAALGLDLPGAGRIATLLASAVVSRTPTVSVGTFDARVSSDGEVLGITVRTFWGADHAAWAEAAAAAHVGLDDTTLIMPGHLRHGALVSVRVTQDAELPSGKGRKPRRRKKTELETHPTLPFVPKPGRLSRREEPIVTTEDLLPPDMRGLGNPETMLPPCNTDGSGCHYIGHDLVDLGSRATRVVRTYVTVAPIEDRSGGPRRGVKKRTRRPAATP